MRLLVLFPLLTLVLSVILSLRLFVDWFKHGRRPWFLLFWSLSLFLMYWFLVPLIFTGLGKVITVTDFNLFFALTLPVTFLALIFVYIGVLEITGAVLKKNTKIILFFYFLLSLLFFAYQFILNDGIIKTYALPLIGNLAFYLPLRILIVSAVIGWLVKPGPKTLNGYLGAFGIIGDGVLGGIRNILIVKNVLAYPPEFWYVVLSGMHSFFYLQIFSIVLIAFGFFFFHRMYYREWGISLETTL